MSFELVYTSARRGLRDGASGFCTVAATEGIPRLLLDKLETLSGYRHTEAAAGQAPPVNYSHVSLRIQRDFYHVLSRIGDAGSDYSGRTNKIAHHLALTPAELAQFPHGPSSLFADDSFWHEEWPGDPETLSPDHLPQAQSSQSGQFTTWEAVYGDAGWAGILGKAASDGMQTVSVIVRDTETTRDLLDEAFQLVSPDKRWKVCFSTYFAQQAPGTDCHWRFVLDGTREARKLRARSLGILIDPFGSGASLPDNDPFVEAARNETPRSVHNQQSTGRRTTQTPEPARSGRNLRPSQMRRKRALEESRRQQRQESDNLEYLEEYEDEDEDHPTNRGTKSAIIWIVLSLLVTGIAVLGFLAVRKLS